MHAGTDLSQCRRHRSARTGGSDRRGGANVHEVDHRDRGVRLGKRRDDRREGPRAKRGSSDLGGEHQPEEPGLSEGSDRFGGEATLLIVLPSRRDQHAIGHFLRIGNTDVVIHRAPRHPWKVAAQKCADRGRLRPPPLNTLSLASGYVSTPGTALKPPPRAFPPA
jgi:hypothetical protein